MDIWYNNTASLITGSLSLLDCMIKVSFTTRRISCQCHTKLPATSVRRRLCKHVCSMFFWNVWHHRLGAPSVPSLVTLTTYQTSHSHSGKLIFPPLDSDYYSLSQHKQELNLRCFRSLKCFSDLVMVKSGGRLSSVEVRTYFSHTIFCCNYSVRPALN